VHQEPAGEAVARRPGRSPAAACREADPLLALQRSAGNAAVAQTLAVQRAPTKRQEMSGMGAHFAVEQYVGVAKKLEENWGRLTPWGRARVLVNAANFELAHIDVPIVDLAMPDLDNNGEFDSAGWKLDLSRTRFKNPAVTDQEAAEIARTAYHEARHAEQEFRVARMLFGRKTSAADIAEKLDMPDEIVAQAKKQPLARNTPEWDEAVRWYESEHGADADARFDTLTRLEQLNEALREARLAADRASTPDEQAAADAKLEEARKAREAAYAAYGRLPEEADASTVGEDVKSTFLGRK
jgi:hypothetical protein